MRLPAAWLLLLLCPAADPAQPAPLHQLCCAASAGLTAGLGAGLGLGYLVFYYPWRYSGGIWAGRGGAGFWLPRGGRRRRAAPPPLRHLPG